MLEHYDFILMMAMFLGGFALGYKWTWAFKEDRDYWRSRCETMETMMINTEAAK